MGQVNRTNFNPTDSVQLDRLSPTGRILVQKRNEIIDAWKEDFLRQNSRGAQLNEPILINTLPQIIDNLAEALSPEYPRRNATEDSSIAEEHGGERARLSNYSLGDVIMEYQLLRDAVLRVLEFEIKLTTEELRIIFSSFSTAIREAATAFVVVHTEIREQFVATLTHDLRNPLNSISMASQLLQNEDLSSEAHALVIKIFENTRRMDRMVQDLLDVTYVRAGGRLTLRIQEGVCANSIVKEIATHMTLSHGNKFVIKGNSKLGSWDAEFLKRAIENLTSNAIKYGDNSKPITIEIVDEAERVAIKVHNEGAPIPINEQESIFQTYRRSESNRGGKKGWGIGLALVRAVAEAHGGSIIVDSAVERGTTFTINIPLDARPYLDSPVTPQ